MRITTARSLKKQNGFALPTTLMLTLAMTMTVSVVGVQLMYDINAAGLSKKKTDASYAAQSAEQRGKAIMSAYVKNAMVSKINTWVNANSNNLSILNSTDTGPGVNNFFYTLQNTVVDLVAEDAINNGSTTGNTENKTLPTRYRICFFNDADGNGIFNSGEESFKFIPGDAQTGTLQTFNFRYIYTTYAYKGANWINRQGMISTTTTGNLGTGTKNTSFGQYALFTGGHMTGSRGQLNFAPGSVFDGPVHTNGWGANDTVVGGSQFQFSGNPGTVFKDEVTSANTDMNWANNGSVINTTPVSTDLNPKNGIKDIPDFQKGYVRGVPPVPLPVNSFGQARAALGGDATNSATPSNNEIRAALGLTQNGAVVPNGIYTPAGGGIYIKNDEVATQPNLDIVMSVDGSNRQNYTIVQGTGISATRRNIIIDRTTNQTIIQTLNSSNVVASTQNLSGVPRGVLHIEGTVNSIGGPPRTGSGASTVIPPAIASDNKLTISGTGDMVIQRDIKYQTDPRGADGVFGTADDQMDAVNTLGFFSSGGDVRIGTSAPDNINIHGIVMATNSLHGGEFKVDNYNSGIARGTATLLGGTITDKYGAFFTFSGSTVNTGYGRNFVYDRRSKLGNAPPFFPTKGTPEAADAVIAPLAWAKTGQIYK